MNIKLRLQNKVTLMSIISLLIAVAFQVMGWLGISPAISQSEILKTLDLLLEALAMLGILVDPTTQGIYDSERAMQYDMPNKPELPEDYFEGGEDDADC